MFNHEPEGYICPFCRLVQGGETAINSQQDIVYHNELVTAFVSPRLWPNNKGHILIIPNEHFENIYDLPAMYAHHIQDVAREIAITFKKAYACDGVSTRQHNEPSGNQEVWHYHLHVFPRYHSDNLYRSQAYQEFASAEIRQIYAQKIKAHLDSTALA